MTLTSSMRPTGAVRVTATARDGQSLEVRWEAAAGATGYRVEVGTGSGLANVASTNAGAVTSHVVNGLTPGTYYVRVRSLSSTATSHPSNEAVATVGGSSGSTAPTDLKATVRSNGLVDLSWAAANGTVTGYRIEVGRGSGQSNVLVSDSDTSAAYTMYGLTSGVYYVRVRAWFSGRLSEPSNEVVVTVGTATPTQSAPALPMWSSSANGSTR